MPVLKWCSAPGKTIEYDEEETGGSKLQQYAYAGLITASVILISKIFLKFLKGK